MKVPILGVVKMVGGSLCVVLDSLRRVYPPIEGGALPVAWGLEHSKYFTLGCYDFLVIVDHKPLTKILGDRSLNEIPNSRLLRLKKMPWIHDITWKPGTENCFGDAISRHPVFSDE